MDIIKYWDFISSIPLIGIWLFSKLIYFVSPYSSSISPYVTQLKNTDKELRITGNLYQHYYIQNPFNSIHAAALINFAEFISGLGMLVLLRELQIKGIVTKITADYLKKARGVIKAEVIIKKKDLKGDEFVVMVELRDEKKDLVCNCSCYWSLKR